MAEFDDELDAKLYALDQLEKGCSVDLIDQELDITKRLTLRYDGLGHS